MCSLWIALLAIAGHVFAGPQAAGPKSISIDSPSETWTYYSTVVTTVSVPTKTITVDGLEVETFTVTDSRTVTEVTTTYDATVASTTVGVPLWLTTTYVDPTPAPTNVSITSVPVRTALF